MDGTPAGKGFLVCHEELVDSAHVSGLSARRDDWRDTLISLVPSAAPNCCLLRDKGKIWIIAGVEGGTGEELTYDYGTDYYPKRRRQNRKGKTSRR